MYTAVYVCICIYEGSDAVNCVSDSLGPGVGHQRTTNLHLSAEKATWRTKTMAQCQTICWIHVKKSNSRVQRRTFNQKTIWSDAIYESFVPICTWEMAIIGVPILLIDPP